MIAYFGFIGQGVISGRERMVIGQLHQRPSTEIEKTLARAIESQTIKSKMLPLTCVGSVNRS